MNPGIRGDSCGIKRTWRKIALFVGIVISFSHIAIADSPNIILIITDDQGIDAVEGDAWPNMLGCHTPTIAQLAAQGRVFKNTRVNPYCSPTRAGLMTGRNCLRTGVTHIVPGGRLAWRLAPAGHERTIAEVLRDVGYYCLLIDKWHLGQGPGQSPPQQGFDVYRPKYEYLPLDDPIDVGDEHVTRMVDLAIEDVANRRSQQPYFLVFSSADPHSRQDRSGREPLGWWRVDERLLPSGEAYYARNREEDTERDRYRAVVEALDTELERLLVELGVIDELRRYRTESNTIVLFIGDNGTPAEVAAQRHHAKGSIHEGGIRVPCFAFGAGVPDDGRLEERPVSHLDFFETICDIVDVPEHLRDGAMSLPRDSHSFADLIGWSEVVESPRRCTVSSVASSRAFRHQVALTDGRYKLISRGGGAELVTENQTAFYDLAHDPFERTDLVDAGMRQRQREAYLQLREMLPNYWMLASPDAINELTVDVPLTHALGVGSNDELVDDFLPVGRVLRQRGRDDEGRALLRFDVEALPDLLPPGKTIGDLYRAQIILSFRSDTHRDTDTDSGPMIINPMTTDWYTTTPTWSQIADAHDPDWTLGMIDLPPYCSLDADDSRIWGVPMTPGTTVSFGHEADLVDLVRHWSERPEANHGVIVRARALEAVYGDQHVTFMPAATLRLSLRP